MRKLAPICLFVYKRHAETEKTIHFLSKNYLAKESDLIIFSDAPKKTPDIEGVQKVRQLINEATGFKSIKIIEQKNNQGLAKSIIQGVSSIVHEHGKVIVLEDDLITSPNFLDFMNEALDFYRDTSKVFAISGFSYPMKSANGITYDGIFGRRSYSWGWATWSDRWALVDWEMSDYQDFMVNKEAMRDFSKGGSDLIPMLKKQMQGKIDSWMIRWVYAQFKNDMLDVFPKISKVQNIGFGDGATHTACSDRRYRTKLDIGTTRKFLFDSNPKMNFSVDMEYIWLHSKIRRAYFKIINQI